MKKILSLTGAAAPQPSRPASQRPTTTPAWRPLGWLALWLLVLLPLAGRA